VPSERIEVGGYSKERFYPGDIRPRYEP
jgi:hypothetical protein